MRASTITRGGILGASGTPQPPRQSLAKAVAYLLAAQFFFNCVDATGKYLVQHHSTVTVVWGRNFFHAIFFGAFMLWRLRGLPPMPAHRNLQILRGLTQLAFAGCLFGALKYLPQAEAGAIVFMAPLLILVLAGPFLRERVTLARWIAVMTGFAGMLVVVRPGAELAPIGVALALAAVVFNAAFQLLTRRLAHSGDPLVTILWTGVIGAVAATLLLPFAPPTQWPTAWEAALFLSFGVTGSVCHLFHIAAYRHAPASAIAPFIFAHIVYAVLFGWLVFGQLPDSLTIVGIAVIVASGAGIALHERRRDPVPRA